MVCKEPACVQKGPHMPEQHPLPFRSFAFTLIEDRRPRAAIRLSATYDDFGVGTGMYELHVEKGSAANPSSQFTRMVPLEIAQRLKDSLQEIGVFSWSEEYGNVEGGASRRWTLNTVFKEGVFSVASKGGSEVPTGFDSMLEELYRLDFPRPAGSTRANAGPGASVGFGAGSAGSAGFGAGAGGAGFGAGGVGFGGDADGVGFSAGFGAGAGGTGVGAGGMGDLGGMMGAAGIRNIGGLSAGDLSAYGAIGGMSGSLDALSRFSRVDFPALV